MKRSMLLGLVLSIATLAGAGGTTMAFAQARASDFTGTWRLDASHPDGYDNWFGNRIGFVNGFGNGNGFGSGGGYGNGFGNGQPGQGSWNRNGDGRGPRGFGAARLPEVLRIETNRRTLMIENERGNLIGEVSVGRGGDDLRMVRDGIGETTIVETISLEDRGSSLVVHTTMSGPRGERQRTSVYTRG